MITRVPFGDWSEDGHKVHADVWVSIPEWDSIPKAQEKIKQKYGQDFFKTMSHEYDEYTLSSIHWQALYDAGFTEKDFIHENREGHIEFADDEFNCPTDKDFDFFEEVINHPENWNVYPEALIRMFFKLVNKYGAGADRLPNCPFPYNPNIETVGYGAFSAYE
jgi:hypothetical protein